MRLFGGDSTSRLRGARHPHNLRLPLATRESHHASLASRDCFSSAREAARQPFDSVIRDKPPNAAHHAPAHEIAFDDIIRVAGRVHALVRLRPPLAHLPSPTSYATTSHQRHARRYRLAPQSGRPPRPPTLQAHCCATRRVYAFNQQKDYIATAI
jgi:hypothetical protein